MVNLASGYLKTQLENVSSKLQGPGASNENATDLKVSNLVRQFLVKITSPDSSEKQPGLSEGAKAAESPITDAYWGLRWTKASFSSQVVGATIAENAVMGVFVAINAFKGLLEAKKIGDSGGVFEGGINTLLGISQTFGGALYAAYYGLMIARRQIKIPHGVGSINPLGRAANGCAYAGNILYAIYYLFVGIGAIYGLVKDCQFSRRLRNAEKQVGNGDLKAFEFLRKKAIADPVKKLEKLQESWNGKPNRKNAYEAHFEKITLNTLADLYDKMPKGKNDKEVPREELIAELKRVLDALPKDADDMSLLAQIGFGITEMNRQAIKEAKLERVAPGCKKRVDKAVLHGLSERLNSGDTVVEKAAKFELKKIKGDITVENRKSKILHTALLIIAVIGVVASILSLFALPVTLGIVLAVACFTVGILAVGTDITYLVDGVKQGAPGQHDKKYVAFLATLLILALAASITLTVIFAMPLMPLLLAGGIAVLGLGVCGFSLYKLYQREKAWEKLQEEQNLKGFWEFLNEQRGERPLDENITAQFKKLPKADREAIRTQYKAMRELGQMQFKSERSSGMIAKGDFNDATPGDIELWRQAVKKTAKFYWESYAMRNATEAERTAEADKEMALQLHGLLDRIVERLQLQGKLDGSPTVLLAEKVIKRKTDNKNEVTPLLASIKSDPKAFELLMENLHYVAKREESLADLMRVVEALLSA